MRIGVDARVLSKWCGGSSVYLKNILQHLAKIDLLNEYYLYSNREFDLPFGGPRWHKRIHSQFARLPGPIWLQTVATRMIGKDSLDAYWGAGQSLPLRLSSAIRKVLTIHDFVWRFYPETMHRSTYWSQRLFAGRSIRSADRLIASSESTASDLERLYSLPRTRIQVVYLGVGDYCRRLEPHEARRYIVEKYGASERYICSVSTVEPRKNFVTLLKSVKILRDRGVLDFQLVIAGAQGWKGAALLSTLRSSGLTDRDVKFVGYVPDEDLALLYSGALAFVFPSLYEGFGLPLVEAMACGVPVVASDSRPIPEIVGDAAILVPARESAAFADAIESVIVTPSLRQSLIDKGLKRSRRFSWKDSARGTLQVLERCLVTGELDGPNSGSATHDGYCVSAPTTSQSS